RVRNAVAAQFAQTSFGTLTAMLNEPSVRLGERLAALVPGDFEKKVWYGLHGSDANDCLAKLVPLATGRRRMISFIGGRPRPPPGGVAARGGRDAAPPGAGAIR